MEGTRHYRNAARPQYGHKNKPCEVLVGSGLDIYLALRSCIATLCLAVTNIGTIFVTAKYKAEKILFFIIYFNDIA